MFDGPPPDPGVRRTSSARRIPSLILPVVVIALSALVHLPGLFVGPSLDAAVFDVVGWQVAHGVPLYSGIWDHKPPGIYVLYAAVERVRGGIDPWVLMWLLSVLACAGTALLNARILVRSGLRSVAPAVAVLVALVSGQYLVSLGGGLAEQPATMLVALSVLLVASATSLWRCLLAGVVFALGLLISVQVGPALLAGVVLIWRAGPLRMQRLLAAAAGGLLVMVGAIAALAAGGLVPAAFEAVVEYNAAYRGAAVSSSLALRSLPWTVLALMVLAAPAAAGLLAMRRVPAAATVGLAAAAWIGAGILLIAVQGRFYAHYVIPLVVPLAVLAGIGLADLARLARRSRTAAYGAGIAGVGLVGIALAAGAAGAAQELQIWQPANRQARSVALVIRSLTPNQGTMLVWGNQPDLYRLADRPPAIRFPFLIPLMTPGFASPALIEEIRADLGGDPPLVVVDAGSPGVGLPGLPPLLIDRPVGSEGRDVDLLDPLRAFVRAKYELVEVVDGWPVYRLRD